MTTAAIAVLLATLPMASDSPLVDAAKKAVAAQAGDSELSFTIDYTDHSWVCGTVTAGEEAPKRFLYAEPKGQEPALSVVTNPVDTEDEVIATVMCDEAIKGDAPPHD